jgi:hypothetical protein
MFENESFATAAVQQGQQVDQAFFTGLISMFEFYWWALCTN